MYCTKCGQQLPPAAKFCSNCGASQDGSNKSGGAERQPTSESREFFRGKVNYSEVVVDSVGITVTPLSNGATNETWLLVNGYVYIRDVQSVSIRKKKFLEPARLYLIFRGNMDQIQIWCKSTEQAEALGSAIMAAVNTYLDRVGLA